MAEENNGKTGGDSLASRIIKEREKRNWTQKNLIEKTGLRPRTIHEVENGEPPTIQELERFAKAFGMYVEDLTRGIEQTRFLSPLGKSVRITTVITTAVMIAASFLPVWQIPAILYVIYVICLLYSVQGYAIEGKTLIVKRLLWKTRIPFEGLTGVEALEGAMRHSLRLFGNGGLFAYTGYFRNTTIGGYKAYVTDLNRTVVLRFGEKTIVVSPDSPDAFVRAVNRS
jgi:transcriptional regulator with XRE-family HTH domain